MSDKRIVRYTLETMPLGKVDWARIEAMTEEDLERSIAGDPDADPRMAPEDFAVEACARWVRLDQDVAAWLKGQDDPDAVANAILRAHIARKDAAE